MKRHFVVIAAILAIIFVSVFAFQSESRPVDTRQFHGKAEYQNGNPAPQGTSVDAWLGSVKVADGAVWDTRGNYNIFGDNSNFPSGTYNIVGDDGSLMGSVNIYHAQGTDTYVDVVLDTAY